MKYFEVGNVSRRELYDALKTAGGLSPWNPITEPTKIIAGVYSSPGSFVLAADFNGVIDDVSSSSKGTIIYFFQDVKRWGIISGEDKNKGVFQTLIQLQTAYPTATNGDYALVVATATFFSYNSNAWNNTGSNVAPDALRATNNLNDLINKSTARTNLDVYNKKETKDSVGGLLVDTATIDFTYSNAVGTENITAIIKDNSISNVKITSDADIATSKLKQAVITPTLGVFSNNDTQDVINNKAQGQISNLDNLLNTRPVGASNGNVYYLTSQPSIITDYELLSFSPDPSALDIESITVNSTTIKANRLIGSYIANYEVGATVISGGNWLFNLYGYASNLNNNPRFEIDILKRTVAGAETLLFTSETANFLYDSQQANPELNIANVEKTQQDFACNTTDKVVVKIYAKTDRTQNTIITLLHSGADYASHIHTPLIASHNDLAGTQGGNSTEKYHLTLADYNKVGNLDNLLLAKEDAINKASSFSGTPANIKYPTEKLVKDNLDLKENLTNKASAFSAIPADVKYPTEKLVKDNLDLKVDKVAGKSLSTNDYTTAEQTKLAGITAGATVNSTDAVLLARANHTGTQAISTIVDLSTNLSDKFSKTASNEITGLTDKATITDADVLMIDDVADTGKKKKVSALNAYNYINNKLQAQFNNKVGISNTETIDGIKTFSSNITITAIPTLDNHSARLKDVNLKASSLAFRQESVRFIEATYGLDANNGYSPDKPFQTVQAGWNDVNPGGQVKVQGASTYNVGTFTFNASKSSIKTILDNGAKITGTINLVAGNSSMQFYDGKISATINDGAGSTCYFTNVDISGSTINFSNGGYKFIGNSTSSPAVINLTGTGGTLVLQDITGGIVPLNIGAGWTVVYYNCTPGILSNAGIIIDGLNIPVNALIADQATLNAILAQTSSASFGYYIVNFDSPVITGMTIAKGDVFYKVSATGNVKVYTFGNAPASFNLVVSATQRNTVIKSVDRWVVPSAGTSVVDGAKINTIATDIASASTVNLDNATGDIVNIIGTTNITAITLSAGIKRFVRFTGTLILTEGVNLSLPSGNSITTSNGDSAIFIGYANGLVRCVSYQRASGTALVGGAGGGDVSSIETSTTDNQLVLYSGTAGKTIKKSTDSGFIKLNSGVPTAQNSISGAEIVIASSTFNNFVAIGNSGTIVDSNKKLNNTATPTDNDIWSGLKTKTYVDSSVSSDTVVSFSPLASAGQSLDVSTHKFSIFTCDGYAFATLPAALNNAGKVMKIACSSTSVGKLYINGSEKGTNQYYILSSDTAIFECDGNKWILISGPDYVVPVLGSGKQTNGRGFVMAYKENLFGCGVGDQNAAGNPFSPSNFSYTLSQFPLLDTNGSIYKGVVTGWQEILTGYEMAIALTNEGEVFCWGNFWSNGSGGKSRFPRKQVFPAGVVISKVFMTTERNAQVYYALYALSTTGKLYGWGHNLWGNLGINSTTNQNNPVLITTLQDVIITKFSVNAGFGIFCGAIDSTGQLWAWGWNGGLAGTANGSPLGNGTAGTQLIVPTQVSDGTALIANATDVLCISGANAGGYSTAATRIIRADGSSWATGYNGGGSLGINTTTSALRYTRETTLKTNIAEMAGSSTWDNHISAIITGDAGTDPNKVFFAAGTNSRGLIGRGDTNASMQFTLNATQLLAEFQGKMYNNKGIKCKIKMHGSNNSGESNCGILDGDGNFYVSGYNASGYCADGTTTDRYTFNKVKFYTNRRVVDFIFIGYALDTTNRGVLVVFEDGSMASWGINNNGVLGNQIYPSASANEFPQWVIGFEPFNKK